MLSDVDKLSMDGNTWDLLTPPPGPLGLLLLLLLLEVHPCFSAVVLSIKFSSGSQNLQTVALTGPRVS